MGGRPWVVCWEDSPGPLGAVRAVCSLSFLLACGVDAWAPHAQGLGSVRVLHATWARSGKVSCSRGHGVLSQPFSSVLTFCCEVFCVLPFKPLPVWRQQCSVAPGNSRRPGSGPLSYIFSIS